MLLISPLKQQKCFSTGIPIGVRSEAGLQESTNTIVPRRELESDKHEFTTIFSATEKAVSSSNVESDGRLQHGSEV